jgi:hypothetical protein
MHISHMKCKNPGRWILRWLIVRWLLGYLFFFVIINLLQNF